MGRSRGFESLLSTGDAGQVVSILRALGRCMPIFGTSIESLCEMILMITSKLDEMKKVRDGVHDLADDTMKVAKRVCHIIREYSVHDEHDTEVADNFEGFVKSIGDISNFIGDYLKRPACRRFLSSNADMKRVDELRRKMHDSMHTFMIVAISQVHLRLIDLKAEMRQMRRESHQMMYDMLNLQVNGQMRNDKMLQFIAQRSLPAKCPVFRGNLKRFNAMTSTVTYPALCYSGVGSDSDSDSSDDDKKPFGWDTDDIARQMSRLVREHEPPPSDNHPTIVTGNYEVLGDFSYRKARVISPGLDFESRDEIMLNGVTTSATDGATFKFMDTDIPLDEPGGARSHTDDLLSRTEKVLVALEQAKDTLGNHPASGESGRKMNRRKFRKGIAMIFAYPKKVLGL